MKKKKIFFNIFYNKNILLNSYLYLKINKYYF